MTSADHLIVSVLRPMGKVPMALMRSVDLLAIGIVDPTEVVPMALVNTVSGAGLLLPTEATMIEIEEGSALARQPAQQPF